MSNPYQPHDPNNPYGSQPEQNYQQQPYSGPTQAVGGQQPYGQPPQPYGQPPVAYNQPPQPYGQSPVAYGQGYYTPAAGMIPVRPVGVSIIAVWQYIVAGLLGLVTLVVFFAGSLLEDAFGSAPAGLAIAIGIILLLFVALFIAMGIGLWRMKSWAHITTIIIYGLSIALNILGMISGDGVTSNLLSFAIAIATVVYLCLPATRALFRS